MEDLMTDDERAVLDGRLLAAELAVQALLTIIVQHLPTGPDAVRYSLDSLLLALERTRALGNPLAVAGIDIARAQIEQLRSQLETLPAMQPPLPGGQAP